MNVLKKKIKIVIFMLGISLIKIIIYKMYGLYAMCQCFFKIKFMVYMQGINWMWILFIKCMVSMQSINLMWTLFIKCMVCIQGIILLWTLFIKCMVCMQGINLM